jgi:hypothetical protein
MKKIYSLHKISGFFLIASFLLGFSVHTYAQYESGGLTELTGGNWVLTSVKQEAYNKQSITAWTPSGALEVNALCSWKDILDIIHTVDASFKWQEPPQRMQPGSYMNLEAIYTNNEYSTTGKVNLGIKMFFDAVGTNYMAANPTSIEVLKVSKDSRQYNSEVKKGFFYAPKNLFDESNECLLIIDCYIGKDHYVTTYTYTYQP